MSSLILGTAQFGSAYGITNAVGRIPDADMVAILERARDAGVDTFDTASDYGDSQSRLGALAAPGARYITKFRLPEEGSLPDDAGVFAHSMITLGAAALEGVMFHRILDFADPRSARAVDILRSARADGRIRLAGASIYDIDDLELALEGFPDLDILQIPGSVLDTRLLDHPEIARLRSRGVEIHVRSAFLQGILLSEPASLPGFFAPLVPALESLAEFAARSGSTVLGLALRFLRDHPAVTSVVVGTTSVAELSVILGEWAAPASAFPQLPASLPEDLLDPRRWPRVTA